MLFLAHRREWWEHMLGFPLILLSIVAICYSVKALSRPSSGKDAEPRRVLELFLVAGGFVGIAYGAFNVIPVLG